MTDTLRKKLAGLTFKTTDLTVGEAIHVQNARKNNDVASWIVFVAMRVDGNNADTWPIMKPSELWDLTLTELVELTNRAGAHETHGEVADAIMNLSLVRPLIH